MTANVLNRFDQAGPGRDNPLILDGTVATGNGGNIKTKLVTLPIGDVSSAGSVWVAPGVAGTILKISNVIATAITGADSGLTFEIGGTAVTGSAITQSRPLALYKCTFHQPLFPTGQILEGQHKISYM